MSGESLAIIAIVVVTAPVVCIKLWAAARADDNAVRMLGGVGAMHSAVIGGAGIVAVLLGDDTNRYVWWLAAAAVGATIVRLWAHARYARRKKAQA